jgi:amino-acid N-acetyltransferase
MRIERATAADTAAVEDLLRAARLPLEGAAAALSMAVVARDENAIVGAAAIERYGSAGLLRSVVVAPDRRGTGLGREIVAAAESMARAEGIRELYLVTETAERWFPRLGYEVVERAVAEAAVGESIELKTVCRDTGVPMHRRLD